MVSEELATKLCEQVYGRIAKYHRHPETIYIEIAEMQNLCEAFPTNILLNALTKTAAIVKRKPSIMRSNVLRSATNIASQVLKESNARGCALHHKPKDSVPTVPPTPRPAPKVNSYTETLLAHWVETIASNHDWMPLDSYMEGMLRQYDADTILAAMDTLGRAYADIEAQAALDAVQNAIDHIIWQKELTQV